MASVPFSTSTNPYTLTGTTISETDSDMKALAARVHLQNLWNADLTSELWYYRNSAWSKMALSPCMSDNDPIEIEQKPFQPSICKMTLYDNAGDYVPENKNSTYNYVSTTYDPLLDVSRKMLLRLGVKCYANLASGITPTASRAVDSGALANLTDGVFSDFTGGTPLANQAGWTTVGSETITITLDLGSSKTVWNVVARFGTRKSAYLLPTSVNVQVSTNGSTWTSVKGTAKPLGTDWDDDYDGRAVEAIVCLDYATTARYVRWQIVVGAAQSIVLDQVAVYGGATYTFYGRNLFTGYLGDNMEVEASGRISISLTDTLKKLADNNSNHLTPTYQDQDLANIATYLMTSNGMWARQSSNGYDSAVSTAEIGWYGTLTGFVFPIFQGSTNSLLGYLMELWQSVGYNFYADGNGYFQAKKILSTNFLPDRVFVGDTADGNGDAWGFVRQRNGRNLRNAVFVTTGRVSSGGGSLKVSDPNSVAQYGEYMMTVQDPVLTAPSLQLAMATNLLRDYAWRTQTATVALSCDFDTMVKQVYGFRMALRPNVFPKSSATVGDKRLGELWQANSLTHRISATRWYAQTELSPYYASAQDPPYLVSLSSVAASTTITATFTAITNSKVSSVQMWVSTSQNDPAVPYTLNNTVSNSGSPTTIDATGLTNGTRYYVYLKTVDYRGMVSTPSNTLSLVCGSGSTESGGWNITDLTASITQADSSPDALGYYTYAFTMAWTSPPGHSVTDPALGGFKRMGIHLNVGKSISSITRSGTTATATCTAHGYATGDSVIISGTTPSGYNGTYTVTVVDANTFTYTCSGALSTPTGGSKYCANAGDAWEDWVYYSEGWEWHGDYVPPSMSWDRVTPGSLYWGLTFRSTHHFTTGEVIFFKMWTSYKTTEWVGYFPSNIATYTF